MPVVFEDFNYVGGFAADRQLARPDKRWPACFRFNEWKTVCIHLCPGQSADDEFRQEKLNEGILLEDHALTFLGAQIAKQVENATIVFIICDRGDRYLSTGVFPG